MYGVVRRFFRILRVAVAVFSLFLSLVVATLWVRSLLAPPAATTGLVKFSPYPDKWFLYAQSGKLLLVRERSILDKADVPNPVKSGIDKRSVLGFGTERWQNLQNWPVERGTLTYGTDFEAYFCPLWASVLLFLLLPLLELPRIVRNLRRRRRGLCMNCGYDLRASPSKCPECGAAVSKIKSDKSRLPTPR